MVSARWSDASGYRKNLCAMRFCMHGGAKGSGNPCGEHTYGHYAKKMIDGRKEWKVAAGGLDRRRRMQEEEPPAGGLSWLPVIRMNKLGNLEYMDTKKFVGIR
jgi:hypothetical protein